MASLSVQARAKELLLELLNSARLREHFEENPGDLALLRHDKPLAKAASAPHLKHLPAYLRDPAAMSGVSSAGNTKRGAACFNTMPYICKHRCLIAPGCRSADHKNGVCVAATSEFVSCSSLIASNKG